MSAVALVLPSHELGGDFRLGEVFLLVMDPECIAGADAEILVHEVVERRYRDLDAIAGPREAFLAAVMHLDRGAIGPHMRPHDVEHAPAAILVVVAIPKEVAEPPAVDRKHSSHVVFMHLHADIAKVSVLG